MSTRLFFGVMPAARRQFCIHSGEGPIFTILDRNTRIARCGFAIFHLHVDLQIAVIDGESAHVGPLQFDGLALAF